MPKSKTKTTENAFKHLFNEKHLARLGDAIFKIYPEFETREFESLIKQLSTLEMKPRVRAIRDQLRTQLPTDYVEALSILLASIEASQLKNFDLWPYIEFIQTYGRQDIKRSLNALKLITKLFTSEFAVRPFLIIAPKITLAYLEKCARDPNPHVRRWASEGSRPRLPWGERLQDFIRDPSPALPILEILKFDPELYVRKSVSNHLNDIAKDHPALVMSLLSRWKKEARSEHLDKVEWIIRRSLRTLIKEGHLGALKMVDVSIDAKLALSAFRLNQKIFYLGDRMEFKFKVKSLSAKPQKLVVDYIIHFMKANLNHSPKVFKLKTFTLKAGDEVEIKKMHHLKKITTRVFYPGLHQLEIQINGRIQKKCSFQLTL